MTAKRGAAVVTGAADGIGAATAIRLAERYRLLVVNYRSSRAAAERVAERIRAHGGAALPVAADVSEEAGVGALFTAVDEAGEPLELLVNNAGDTGGFARVDELRAEQLDSTFRSCLRSTALCTREAVTRMTASRGGCVINISSTAARTTGAGEWVHYAAVKAAVNTFTRGAATELADRGIRVNAVAPGLVRSPLHERNGDRERPDRLGSTVPVGRVGEPAEIADAVAFLASEEASYITGHILEVSGGR
ncbi:NAD(P)-dependent dehydrogenase (short-subunit alcohol dehydrogenase family) [Saccharomonospora amisosensis]|uniref:NAD(P)-dependent dehydrogenase (Short-subunit alcohol dehydrogenase family) n=1 Tax=Saccharomonospora amisosensis TaxID=1128677 RepID=A0A7X5UU40_9PSEU|nr:SDR family NAD(P)-dependent oxidoreductase [Saccharomonospora amisosensis]NIJ14284.1 NAD(P)-dependent dehydrogenase (short-subunit alcohol dehydrogenase family) [Saccharomonospora amisosensis]